MADSGGKKKKKVEKEPSPPGGACAAAAADSAQAAKAKTSAQLKKDGNKAHSRKDYTKAVELYTKAIAAFRADGLQRDLALLYANRAASYQEMMKLTEAEADAQMALKKDAKFVKAHRRLADVRRVRSGCQGDGLFDAVRSLLAVLEWLTDDLGLKNAGETSDVLFDLIVWTYDRETKSFGWVDGYGDFSSSIMRHVCKPAQYLVIMGQLTDQDMWMESTAVLRFMKEISAFYLNRDCLDTAAQCSHLRDILKLAEAGTDPSLQPMTVLVEHLYFGAEADTMTDKDGPPACFGLIDFLKYYKKSEFEEAPFALLDKLFDHLEIRGGLDFWETNDRGETMANYLQSCKSEINKDVVKAMVKLFKKYEIEATKPKDIKPEKPKEKKVAPSPAPQKSNDLTRGALEKMLSGEKPDRPVLQMLSYSRLTVDSSTRYRVLLNDGQHTYSSAVLAKDLNQMIESGQLSAFAVVRLEKYVCCDNTNKSKNASLKVIRVEKMAVVRSPADVASAKIGNPKPLSEISKKGTAPPDPRENLLTRGAIEQLLTGRKPQNPVVQVIDKYPDGKEKFRFVLSDGKHYADFSLLYVRPRCSLEKFCTLLENFSVVRLEDYDYAPARRRQDGSESLPLLNYDNNLLVHVVQRAGSKIGSPKPFSLLPDDISGSIAANPGSQKGELTRGAINNMLTGGKPDRPILQMLGFRRLDTKHLLDTDTRYRILLSDGVHTYSSGLIAEHLNPMITSGELSGHPVIRLDKYICAKPSKKESETKKVIEVQKLTIVLSSASISGARIGDPQPWEKVASPPDPRESMLTQGAIREMAAGKKPDAPVLQILHLNPESDGQRYKILFSDGKFRAEFTLLAGVALDMMMMGGMLDTFMVVRLVKYEYTTFEEDEDGRRPVLTITLLQNVKTVTSKIGDPEFCLFPFDDPGGIPAKSVLTRGAIKDLIAGGHPDRPVLQVLSFRMFHASTGPHYPFQLMLSDGQHWSTMFVVILPLSLEIMMGELQEFAIIRLDAFEYRYVRKRPSLRFLSISALEVLMKSATESGGKIGDPTGTDPVDTNGTNPEPIEDDDPEYMKVALHVEWPFAIDSISEGDMYTKEVEPMNSDEFERRIARLTNLLHAAPDEDRMEVIGSFMRWMSEDEYHIRRRADEHLTELEDQFKITAGSSDKKPVLAARLDAIGVAAACQYKEDLLDKGNYRDKRDFFRILNHLPLPSMFSKVLLLMAAQKLWMPMYVLLTSLTERNKREERRPNKEWMSVAGELNLSQLLEDDILLPVHCAVEFIHYGARYESLGTNNEPWYNNLGRLIMRGDKSQHQTLGYDLYDLLKRLDLSKLQEKSDSGHNLASFLREQDFARKDVYVHILFHVGVVAQRREIKAAGNLYDIEGLVELPHPEPGIEEMVSRAMTAARKGDWQTAADELTEALDEQNRKLRQYRAAEMGVTMDGRPIAQPGVNMEEVVHRGNITRAVLYNNRCRVYMKLNKFKEAEEDIRLSIPRLEDYKPSYCFLSLFSERKDSHHEVARVLVDYMLRYAFAPPPPNASEHERKYVYNNVEENGRLLALTVYHIQKVPSSAPHYEVIHRQFIELFDDLNGAKVLTSCVKHLIRADMWESLDYLVGRSKELQLDPEFLLREVPLLDLILSGTLSKPDEVLHKFLTCGASPASLVSSSEPPVFTVVRATFATEIRTDSLRILDDSLKLILSKDEDVQNTNLRGEYAESIVPKAFAEGPEILAILKKHGLAAPAEFLKTKAVPAKPTTTDKAKSLTTTVVGEQKKENAEQKNANRDKTRSGRLTWRPAYAPEKGTSVLESRRQAEAHMAAGAFAAAHASFSEAIREVQDMKIPKKDRAALYAGRAAAAVGMKKWEDVDKDCKQALKLNPNSVQAYKSRSYLLEARGDLEELNALLKRFGDIAKSDETLREQLFENLIDCNVDLKSGTLGVFGDADLTVDLWQPIIGHLVKRKYYRVFFNLIFRDRAPDHPIHKICAESYNLTDWTSDEDDVWLFGKLVTWLLQHGAPMTSFPEWKDFEGRRTSFGMLVQFLHGSSALLDYQLSTKEQFKEANYPNQDGFHYMIEAYSERPEPVNGQNLRMGAISCLRMSLKAKFGGGDPTVDELKDPNSAVCRAIKSILDEWKRDDHFGPIKAVKPPESYGPPPDPCDDCYSRLDRVLGRQPCDPGVDIYDLLCPVLEQTHEGQKFDKIRHEAVYRISADKLLQALKDEKEIPSKVAKLGNKAYDRLITDAWTGGRYECAPDWSLVLKLVRSHNARQKRDENVGTAKKHATMSKVNNVEKETVAVPSKSSKSVLENGENASANSAHPELTKEKPFEGIARWVDLHSFLMSDYLIQSPEYREEALKTLLEAGALAIGIFPPDCGGIPLKAAAEKRDGSCVPLLIRYGASPSDFHFTDSDTPLHAALQVALTNGDSKTLECFRELYIENPDKYPFLAPEVQDANGDTLLHMIARASIGKNKKVLHLTEYLRSWNIDPNLVNNEKKKAQDYLDPIDRRRRFLQADISSTPTAAVNGSVAAMTAMIENKTRQVVAKLNTIVDGLPELALEGEQEMSDTESDNEEEKEESKSDLYDLSSGEREVIQEKIITSLDDLPWEVECTSDVWKTLLSKKIGKPLRQLIVYKIRELASGSFSASSHENLGDDLLGLRFGEVLVVWQVAIAFSGRRSEESADRKVYAEIIRIWDVIVHADRRKAILTRIVGSIKRGQTSVVRKHLRGIEGGDQMTEGKRFPATFSIEQTATDNSILWSPPASSKENEYHIMKFYSFTSAMADYIYENEGSKVDFPFNVTDIEYTYVHLTPKPPSPLLILGRSGTGKTTCCLYRLWVKYQTYWHSTNQANPLIPRITNSEDDRHCDHLHQVFITKNKVLTTEVRKNFTYLSRTSAGNYEDLPSPIKLQDVEEKAFPLFMTSRQFLLLLDGSMPHPFFERDGNGLMLNDVEGWGSKEKAQTKLVLHEDEDRDETTQRKARGAQQEVTYEIFAHKLWPKLRKASKKKGDDFHPSLVWMEIISFIKGSHQAVQSEEGYLTLEEYQTLGRKQAPHFTGDREEVYYVFEAYRHALKTDGYFDECDVIHHVYQRLEAYGNVDWVIHQIFVDEVQDFTQSELCVLIQACQEPDQMFFTGDTAQSIMRGVAFRFTDLKTLFHGIEERGQGQTKVTVPKHVYKLTQNYRSHAGVIRLANGIIELLKHYFPQSFDHVKRDVALFEGPRPVVFDSVEFEDLALVLRGNKRHASQIEFGAHQAIIVANEAARDQVPEELSHCLILTVYEAKGLEFDDVLLFNYFKYSEASHEWRVVSQYLQDLASRQESESADDADIVQVDLDAIAPDERAHPLGFDPEKHKILISELKHLYTAVTRARVNIWIYDEDVEARKPMFEFFKARKLVDAKQTVRDGTSLEGVFVKKSTASDWRKIGKEFYKREQYGPAAKCFKRAGDEVLHKICAAHQLALSAQNSQSDSSRRDQYLQAALQFLQCPQWRHLYDSAATCLRNGKEPLLAARVYARIGKFADAGSLYRRCKQYDLAVDCYERADMYDLAIRLLCDQRRFQDALDAWKVYEAKVKECHQKRDTKRSAILSKHRPQSRDDKNTLSFRVAENNLMNDDIESVTHILEGLKWDTDQIADWMADKGKRKAAAVLLENKGKLLEAAARYREMNDYPSAIACLERCKDLDKAKRQLADCYLVMCRRYYLETKDGNSDPNPNYRLYMDNALEYFDQLRLPSLSGHCRLLEGAMCQTRDQDGALDQSFVHYTAAYKEFQNAGSDIGQLVSLYQMMNIRNLEFKQEVMALRLVISVLNGLGKRSGGVYEDLHQFYGIDEGFVDKNAQTRIADLDSSLIGYVEIVKANQEIRKTVLRKLEYIVKKSLKCAKERCEMAKSFLLGPGNHHGTDERTINMMKDLGHVILVHGVLIDLYLTEPTVRNLLDGLADFNLKCAEEMVRLLYFARPRFAKVEAFVRPLVELLHGRYKVPMFCHKADLRYYEDDEALRKLDSDCTQLLMLMYCSLLSGQFKGDHPFGRIYSLLKEMESGPRIWPGQYFYDGKKINFFRVCLRSFEDHYLERDPHLAMITCNQFLRHLSVRSKTIRAIKPSTESLLPIWELQLMRGMLLYVKASPPIPAFVPKSYFSLLNLLDVSCGGSTKDLVQNFEIRNTTSFATTIRNQLSSICQIFLGVTSRQFNVLKDAATVKNVETLERLLTFGFILLVNVGLMIEENLSFSDRRSKKNRRTLNIPTEEILVRRIQRLVKDTKLRSPGISSLTDLIRTARGARDLTIGLAEYLKENNDALMEVSWDDCMDNEEEDFSIIRAESHLELENKYILFNPEKTSEGYKVLHELSDNHEPVAEIEDKQILDRVLNVTNTPESKPEPEPADLYTDERRCDVCGTTFISDKDTPEQLRQQHKSSDEHNRMVIHYEKYQLEIRPFVEDMIPKVQSLESVRFEELSPDVVRAFYMFRESWNVFDGKRKDVEKRRDWQSSGMLTLYTGRLTQIYTQLSAKIRACEQTLSEQSREDPDS